LVVGLILYVICFEIHYNYVFPYFVYNESCKVYTNKYISRIKVELGLGWELGLVWMRFRSNVFSIKCSRSRFFSCVCIPTRKKNSTRRM